MIRIWKKPSSFTIEIAEIGQSLESNDKETLLQTALGAGIEFPHMCRVGSCGQCKSRLLLGRTRNLVDLSYVLGADEIREGYILPCQAIPLSDCVLSNPKAVPFPEFNFSDDEGA